MVRRCERIFMGLRRLFHLLSDTRLGRAARAAGLASLLFAGQAQGQDLNAGFRDMNAGFRGMNGADATLGQAARMRHQGGPNPIYDRARYPQLWERYGTPLPSEVVFNGNQPAGSIVIDHKNQHLYLILAGQRAVRYNIVVGRAGKEISGARHSIGYMAEDPTWEGPDPNPFRHPGLQNPLGARGLFLVGPDGVDQGYAIHGTNQPRLLAQADGQRKASNGCIRMHNDDVMNLYGRVRPGAQVFIYYRNEVALMLNNRGAAIASRP